MDTDAGTARSVRTLAPASPAGMPEPAELSQNFLTPIFYFLVESPPTRNCALELLMRTIRQILRTEYIGTML